MMPQVDIVEAKAWHCGRMARLMRHEHQVQLMRRGLDPHRVLRSNFEASSWRRSAFLDGKLVAMAGVIGADIASTGFLWLVISQDAMKYPALMTRMFRRHLDLIMQTKHEIATVVNPEDDAALRLAVFIGFHVDHTGPGMPATSRMGRRDLLRYLVNNTELPATFGNGYGIPMGYHRENAALDHIAA